MKKNYCKYVISFGIKDNIAITFATLFFGIIAYLLHRQGSGAFVPVSCLACFCAVIFVVSIYRTLFNKIYIYDDYFVHIKSPTKKVIVNDYEVEDAWIKQKLSAGGNFGYYFHYVTKDGRNGNMLVSTVKYDFADYLVERLKGEDVSEYERHIDAEYGYTKHDVPKDATLFERLFVFSNKGAVIITVLCVALLALIFGNMFINTGRKTPYTAAQVAEVMQNYGYDAQDNSDETNKENSSIEHSVYCISEYPYVEFTFFELDSDSSAKALSASIYKQLRDKHIPNSNIGESYYNNYSSLTLHCEGDYYYEIVRVSNTVALTCSKESTKDKAYELLQAIDYDQKTDKVKTKTE